jgi:hypothetical protein
MNLGASSKPVSIHTPVNVSWIFILAILTHPHLTSQFGDIHISMYRRYRPVHSEVCQLNRFFLVYLHSHHIHSTQAS